MVKARRVIVFGVPLVLGLLELGHPALVPGQSIYETIAPIATWWTALHVVQIPLFGLLAFAVFILVRGLDTAMAGVSRIAAAVFAVVYPAFDAAVGVASGIYVQSLGTLNNEQETLVETGLQSLFWGPVTGSLYLTGGLAWLISLVTAAFALRSAGASRWVAVLLIVAGLLLALAHIPPFGPLACLCFLLAAMFVEFRQGIKRTGVVTA